MILLIFFIAFVFVFFCTHLSQKNADAIKPTKNMFEKFVDSDHGYPWSQRKKGFLSKKT